MAKRGRVSVKKLVDVLHAAEIQLAGLPLAIQIRKVIDGYERGDILVLENEMPL